MMHKLKQLKNNYNLNIHPKIMIKLNYYKLLNSNKLNNNKTTKFVLFLGGYKF